MTENPPVVLVHGMGSNFEHNWRRHGWVDVLEADGREVIGFDMPGHGASPLVSGEGDGGVTRLAQVCDTHGPVDIVGFSAGSVLSLTTAVRHPGLFCRIALLGIADTQLRTTPERKRQGVSDLDSPVMRAVSLAAERAGNDVETVLRSALMTDPVPSFDDLGRITAPVLLVLGERDFLGSADSLLASLRDGQLVTIPEADHFSTPQRFESKMAVADFLMR